MAWLMVGLDLYLLSPAWRSDLGGLPLILEMPVLVVAFFAWCASALAGDQPFHAWMFPVKWLAVLVFGMLGAQFLLFGALPEGGQNVALGLTSIWIAWVFTRPPRHPYQDSDPYTSPLPGLLPGDADP